MTITQALIIVLLIAIATGITGAELSNNTNFLILLLIALIALSRANTALANIWGNCNNLLTTTTTTNGNTIII